jgi:AraC-like DNA-binding protein
MSPKEEKSIGVNSDIWQEQFIPSHIFLYITRGMLRFFDGEKTVTFKSGEYFIARKNRLSRYIKERSTDEFEYVAFLYEEDFLKLFQDKYAITEKDFYSVDTFVRIKETEVIPFFIRSLKFYYNSLGNLNDALKNVKYEELLIILLQNQPELAGLFFDFGIPQKIDLEKFMIDNYRFNVSIERFAFLTGRSLSAFKRDFENTFKSSPGKWLLQQRLEEASFLIMEKKQKASEIYLNLGFENLSHFSYAYKKRFGHSPSKAVDNNEK